MTVAALVVTTIHEPGPAMRACAEGAMRHGVDFIAVGDVATPAGFALPGCRFLPLAAQRRLPFAFAAACPERSYARKAVGYLAARAAGATLILETDDDNAPTPGFWTARQRVVEAPAIDGAGWTNIYRYFADGPVWPRGLPLDRIHVPLPPLADLPVRAADCPIQQGLVDGDADVDAILRLVLPGQVRFRAGPPLALGEGSWCPFNSQNTAWWRPAFPLLYLPVHCSFRVTDIWRSLVAQRIAWANGWRVLFHGSTMVQARNAHDLMRDFADEVPAYLHDARLADILAGLPLPAGEDAIPDNLVACYAAIVAAGLLPAGELDLLRLWLADCRALRRGTP